MIRFKVTEPVFDTKVHVVTGSIEDRDSVVASVLHNIAPEERGIRIEGGVAWKNFQGNPLPIFVLYVAEDTDRPVGVLVHEVAHLVDRIFQRNDIPTGVEATETRARLSEFFFNRIYKKMMEKQ